MDAKTYAIFKNVSSGNSGVGVSTASDVSISDASGYFDSNDVEGALQEIGAELSGINTLIGTGVIA